jgi:phosphodiesterase/alkaline phosphatase D-like protein
MSCLFVSGASRNFLRSAVLALVFASFLTAIHASPVGWAWTGGITADAAVITARIDRPIPAGIRLEGSSKTIMPVLTAPMEKGVLHRFVLGGLKADTTYSYRFVDSAGAALDEETRVFRTFPAPGKPASFRFAVSSCARATNSPAFAAIARQTPRFMIHTGDFHYSNIGENQVEIFRKAYNAHLSSPHLRSLLAAVPLMYTWDDHDFGPNDSNKNSPSREASLRNFRELVPHHPLTVASEAAAPVDQAFTIGRVTFILSDLRSQRDPAALRMMSEAQDEWLRKQFLAARDAGSPLIFWVTSVPWNGRATKADRWQGYPAHRTEIANFIKDSGLAGKVVILSGDAHMTAIDDGSHSDFATNKGAPIRVFQAGPLANVGSYKGGPYSHGARYKTEGKKDYIHQFGLVDVHDDGKRIRVTFSGRQGADGRGDEVLLSERDAEGPIQFEFLVP